MAARSFTDWCVWWGGEDPNDCAGLLVYDDQAEAEEMTQWISGGQVAHRTVARGAWVKSPLGADDCDHTLSSWAAQYVPLLGKRVRVTLDEQVVAEGILLGFGDGGTFEIQEDDGFVHHGWPMLAVEEAPNA